MSRLAPHAFAIVVLAAVAIAWDPLAQALPALDALLAPGAARLPELVATALLLVVRTAGLLLLPGMMAAVLVDAAILARTERRGVDAG